MVSTTWLKVRKLKPNYEKKMAQNLLIDYQPYREQFFLHMKLKKLP